ncbi:hypothetical protein [Dactylosporangium sp. NPDC005555]|uniref:hypothetical protein n=1 Tax=Dactylosporangium sp. NPDC005555 TaxID=3154889 RepID=UPI00339E5A82
MNAQDPTGVDPDSPEGRARAAARREHEQAQSRAVHEQRGGRIDDGAVDSTGQLVREPRRATQLDEDI